MTRDKLQTVLIELGWASLIHRVLAGRPAETIALQQLMRCAGRPVTYADFAEAYDGHVTVARSGHQRSGSVVAVKKRIDRLRAALSDLGLDGVIHRVATANSWGGAYMIEKRDVPRIEAAILFASGVEIEVEPLRVVGGAA
jgi:hypothetical protein